MDYAARTAAVTAAAKYEHIRVLVWGPGDPGPAAPADRSAAYEKRLKIKKVLRAEFPCAEVYFSEDPEMDALTNGAGGVLRREALQAYTSNLVIMLDLGRGVDLELDHYVPTYGWFCKKVHVFLPGKYLPATGLVKEVLDLIPPRQIEGFTDAEFADCSLATGKAVRAALAVAIEQRLRDST